MANVCGNCGAEIPEGASFCPGCGTKVPAQANTYITFTRANTVSHADKPVKLSIDGEDKCLMQTGESKATPLSAGHHTVTVWVDAEDVYCSGTAGIDVIEGTECEYIINVDLKEITIDEKLRTPKNQYCPNCGAKVTEGSSFCSSCGYNLREQKNTQTQQQPVYTVNVSAQKRQYNSTAAEIIKVFLVLTCIGLGLLIIPLAWCIPMTVTTFKRLDRNEPLGTGLTVCTMLFVNLIAGIIMICIDNDS